MTRRRVLRVAAGGLIMLLGLAANEVAAQADADLAGVQAASKAFYAAVGVLDDGAAMAQV
jgi:hypothetical protein